MFVAVYLNGELDVDRDEIEDLLLDALADHGKDRAKVTGGGWGDDGGNIDLQVDDALGADEVLRRLLQALQSSEDVPRKTDIQIEDKTYPLYPSKGKGKKRGAS
jgi:hypothetical protein